MIEQLNWTELNIIPYFPRGLELACRCQLAQIPNLHSRQELSPALTEKHVIGEGRDKKELHFSYNFVIPCCCLIGKLCLTLCDPMDCSPPGFSGTIVRIQPEKTKILPWDPMEQGSPTSEI